MFNIIDPNNYIEKTQIVKQKWSKTYCIRWELGFKKNVKKYNTQELYVNSNPEYQIFPLNYFGCSPIIFHHNHCKIFIFLIHVSLAGKNQVNIHILKILRLFHCMNKENWYSIFLPKNNDIGAIQLLKVEGVKVHFSIHCEKSVKCI